MAARPPFRPFVRLGALGVVLVAMYSGMAASGHLTPSLGLDLRGGTQVILTPKALPGSSVQSSQLSTAVAIIRQRVNGLGVSNADVVTQGNNVVISVPGKGREDVLRQVGQTAGLTFRETWTDPTGAVQNPAANPAATTTTTTSVAPSAGATPTAGATTGTAAPTAAPTATPSGSASSGASVSGSAYTRPLAPAAVTPTPTPSSAAPTTASPAPTASSAPTPSATSGATTTQATLPSCLADAAKLPAAQQAAAKYLCNQGAAETSCVDSLPPGGSGHPNEAAQTTPASCTLQTFESLDCTQNGGRPLDVDEDAKHFVIACDRSGGAKYLLAPADLVGTQVSSATATLGQTSQGASTGLWEVDVTFKDSAINQVQSVSTKLYQNSQQPLAITLDGVVVSDPSTNGVLGKNITISGGSPPFTEKDASNLANALKYGSLPLSFEQSSVQTVSATLGKDSLHGGLLAGAIGLALVVIFVFLYYRMLGFATVLSLLTSGLLVYASVVLLGQAIGYTLTLAGIAGLIVAIGITADSFVVYFERLKDEIREGRSPRLAVEYGWKRAWRTILTADFVSFLAAFILYIVSVGDVKGFAFTLGLSTVLDIVVVQMFTRPLISLLIRYPIFSTSRKSGLHPGSIGRPAARSPKEA